MPAPLLLCHIAGINSTKLSREENIILEAELFVRVCEELKEIIKSHQKNYLKLLKLNEDMENAMLDSIFIGHVVNDILVTGEYSLEGIAYYTNSTVDVISDLAAGRNSEPSFPLSRKIIDMHRSVRPTLYREMIKKITEEHMVKDDN